MKINLPPLETEEPVIPAKKEEEKDCDQLLSEFQDNPYSSIEDSLTLDIFGDSD